MTMNTAPQNPGPPASPARTVWRLDDNGNRFVVREHLAPADADRLVGR